MTVPDLRGRSLADARAVADGLGLALDVTLEETDAAEPDTVLDQRPAPGETVAPGDSVTVVVAQLPRTVRVPDLRRESEADAIAVMAESGLVPGDRDAGSMRRSARARSSRPTPPPAPRWSAAVPSRTPSPAGPEQTPTPSPTSAPIAIPAFVDGPLADARAFADANGLALDVTPRETADAPPDTVLEQDPAQGGELRPGGTLRVTVAIPPRPRPSSNTSALCYVHLLVQSASCYSGQPRAIGTLAETPPARPAQLQRPRARAHTSSRAQAVTTLPT